MEYYNERRSTDFVSPDPRDPDHDAGLQDIIWIGNQMGMPATLRCGVTTNAPDEEGRECPTHVLIAMYHLDDQLFFYTKLTTASARSVADDLIKNCEKIEAEAMRASEASIRKKI